MTSISGLQALLSVPKLKTNGSNWIIFSVCLKWALQEKKVFGHLDSTSPQPATTADANEQTSWLDDEVKACHLLAQKLQDSTLTKLLHFTTAALMWTSLTKEFTLKSSHTVAVMCTSFDSLKCANNGNICTHLDKLCFKYEELVGISVTIPTEQYATRIIGSLLFNISTTCLLSKLQHTHLH